MAPLYTHCPHCGFPIVVNGIERALPRLCRQCKGRYIPEEHRDSNHPASGGRRSAHGGNERATLRANVKQRRRSGM